MSSTSAVIREPCSVSQLLKALRAIAVETNAIHHQFEKRLDIIFDIAADAIAKVERTS